MMAPGGAMCEMKVGGEWGEEGIKSYVKKRKIGAFTQQTAPFPRLKIVALQVLVV